MTNNRSSKWWQGHELIFAVGIEDTFIPQTNRGERALDEYELTQHYEQWDHDIELIAESGATMARWGVPWHRVNPAPGVWHWAWLDRVADKFQAVGVVPIVDLMHYGTPEWLDGEFLNPEYPDRVAEYARQVAARYGHLWTIYTPLNEPMLNALYCGLYGYWPPYASGDTGFVSVIRAIARGIVNTQRAITDELGDRASFVHVEASFRFIPDAPEADPEAAFLRERAYLVQDLVTGKVDDHHPLRDFLRENGFTQRDFDWHATNLALPDVMGVNYYPAGQTEVVSVASPHAGGPGDFRPRINAGTEGLEDVLRSFADRYRVPVFLTETSTVGTDAERAGWLDASVKLVRELRDNGLHIVGYTWWSIIDMIEWEYRDTTTLMMTYLLGMGLWALVDDGSGTLVRVRTPLADQFIDHASRAPAVRVGDR